MDRTELFKMYNALPWPEGKKPAMKYQTDGQTHAILLHEPCSRGWTDIVEAQDITPEAAFRAVIDGWLRKMRPANQPAFHAMLRQTWN